jgi:hypothetical protein
MSAKKIMQQAAEHAVADRLKLAADHIRAARAVPDVAICDAIGDSAWFREYCNICLQAPIANSFLGCILFGWQLCEEYRRLADDERVKVYQA